MNLIRLIFVRIEELKVNRNKYGHLGFFACDCITFITFYMKTKIIFFGHSLSAITEISHEANRIQIYIHILIYIYCCGQIYQHYAYGSFRFVYMHTFIIFWFWLWQIRLLFSWKIIAKLSNEEIQWKIVSGKYCDGHKFQNRR